MTSQATRPQQQCTTTVKAQLLRKATRFLRFREAVLAFTGFLSKTNLKEIIFKNVQNQKKINVLTEECLSVQQKDENVSDFGLQLNQTPFFGNFVPFGPSES